MKIINLNSNQIITSSHELLHNIHILKIYFKIYSEGCGKIIPPSPVIHKDLVVSYFNERLKQIFEDFLKRNPQVEYFLLDGSHKTTAADLTENKCRVMIFETNEDLKKAMQMEQTGAIFQYNLASTIEGIIKDLIKHFNSNFFSQTVEIKTRKLISNKKIPSYMY